MSLTAISVLLGGATLALLIFGVMLLVLGTTVWKVVGLLLTGLAIELRPRLPAVDTTRGYKTRAELPALFAVLDAVAAQLGAPRLHAVVVDEAFEATCGRFGLRRRPVLVLGLPLWASLSPAGRMGLLAHELGHLVDRDPEQNLVTQPALSTLGILARDLAKRRRGVSAQEAIVGQGGEVTAGQYATVLDPHTKGSIESVRDLGLALVFRPLYWIFAGGDRRLRALASHSRQRAEYYADALAADVAGSAAVVEYCRVLLLHEPVFTTARRLMRAGADLQTVRAQTADTVTRHLGDLSLYEQHSMRAESSPLASHPPTGRRLRLQRSGRRTAPRLPARRPRPHAHPLIATNATPKTACRPQGPGPKAAKAIGGAKPATSPGLWPQGNQGGRTR
jgi:Zn-dependent protease with chaperone function